MKVIKKCKVDLAVRNYNKSHQFSKLLKIKIKNDHPGCRLGFPKTVRVPEARMKFFEKASVKKYFRGASLPRATVYVFCIWWLRRCYDDFLEPQTLVTRKMLSARALLPSLT
jgi:hypothetical protein